MWKGDYLTSLREKHYGANKTVQVNGPKVGDIVIVERQGPQHEWPLGRIVKLYPDTENIVRTVEVLCNGVISKRTLDKLIPLEVHSSEAGPMQDSSDIGVEEPLVRPMRRAAQKAAELRQILIENEQL